MAADSTPPTSKSICFGVCNPKSTNNASLDTSGTPASPYTNDLFLLCGRNAKGSGFALESQYVISQCKKTTSGFSPSFSTSTPLQIFWTVEKIQSEHNDFEIHIPSSTCNVGATTCKVFHSGRDISRLRFFETENMSCHLRSSNIWHSTGLTACPIGSPVVCSKTSWPTKKGLFFRMTCNVMSFSSKLIKV